MQSGVSSSGIGVRVGAESWAGKGARIGAETVERYT